MKRFYNLKFGDKFSVDDIVYQKENFFSAVRSLGTRDNWAGDAPLYRHYYPWEKVEMVEFPENPLTALFRQEARRFAASITKTLSWSRSPFVDLLTGGVFPFASPPPLGARRGKISREVYEWSKGISSDPRNYGERTGPSA